MDQNKVQKYLGKLTETVLPWLSGDDKNVDWQLHAGKDVVSGVVYKANVPKFGTIWKAQIIMQSSAAAAFRTIAQEGNSSWMPNLAFLKELEKDVNYEVIYQIAQGVSGISDRDFYTIRIHKEFEKGFYGSLACSLVDEDVKCYQFNEPKKCVRGENLPGGMSWKHLDNDTCLWTYIYNVDLKGYLPRSLVNLVVSNFLLQFCTAALQFSKTIPQDHIDAPHGSNPKGKENKLSHYKHVAISPIANGHSPFVGVEQTAR